MSNPKPRVADVARWVAELAAPNVSHFDRVAQIEQARARARSATRLSEWGLDAHGNPKPAVVCCPRGATEPAPIHAMLGCDTSPEHR